MSAYRLTHLDDTTLLHDLSALVSRDRATTAQLLAHIAEVDDRRLYFAAAGSSMFAYCVRKLGLSEDATYKRIQAARAARRFPRLFADVAAGRLHLAAIVLLAPHLTTANEAELVAAAGGRPKAEIEAWLAARFAPADGAAPLPRERLVPIRVKAAGAAGAAISAGELPLARVGEGPGGEPACGPIVPVGQSEPNGPIAASQPAPGQVAAAPPTHVLMQVAITRATEAKLHRAQALLVHAVPSGQISEVLDRALDALLERLEKRRGAAPAPTKPTKPRRAVEATAPIAGTARKRTIPAAVRRAVWARDGGRCTIASADGLRCHSVRGLEFDHVVPFACGGESTAENLRLRCRPHNQFEAERAFGKEFVNRKRAARQFAERSEERVEDP